MKFLKEIISFVIFVTIISFVISGGGYTTQNVEETDKEIMEDWKKSNTIKTQ